jgi:antitoxin VapB
MSSAQTLSRAHEVRLFKNGRNQAVLIPVEFQLPGVTALLHREGTRLVIEAVHETDLLALLATLEPNSEALADCDNAPLPAWDIAL